MSRATVEVIAEAGVNHNGCIDKAMKLVDAAVDAGADVVKFQTFRAETLVTDSAPMAAYQQANTGVRQSQLEMLKQLELPPAAFRDLKDYCTNKGIEFMSSPFDAESLRYLVDELNVDRLKIASGELTNGPLLLAFGNSGCDLILSTGMSDNNEIRDALSVLAFAMLVPGRVPSGMAECEQAFAKNEGQRLLQQRLTLLHCTSQYPAPLNEVNLSAMAAMHSDWLLPVGYSDHTEGVTIPIAAAAMGACIIEKHFTLDRHLPGPDHKASLEPEELKHMVRAIRDVSTARGYSRKTLQPSERNTRAVARKSLVASIVINKGDPLTCENIKVQRPGSGISPMLYWDYLGQIADRDYCVGELLHE